MKAEAVQAFAGPWTLLWLVNGDEGAVRRQAFPASGVPKAVLIGTASGCKGSGIYGVGLGQIKSEVPLGKRAERRIENGMMPGRLRKSCCGMPH